MLGLSFHAFSHHFQSHAVGQGNDGARNGGIGPVGQHFRHKAPVDLQLVQRQALEQGQRRVAGAEVIERQRHAQGLEGAHLGQRDFHAVSQQAFGQFKFEPLRADAGALYLGHHPVDEIGVTELAHADIHRHAQAGGRRPLRPGRELFTGGSQRPLAERKNQAGFLGHRDEVSRRDQSTHGMLPAQ